MKLKEPSLTKKTKKTAREGIKIFSQKSPEEHAWHNF